MMSPTELFDEIESLGGNLTVLPDRSLRCENIAAHLRDELIRLQFVVTAILAGECENVPTPAPSKSRKVGHSKRTKRITCEICKTGQGCRKRGLHQWQLCPLCGHGCRSHHSEYSVAPYGVISAAGCHWPQEKCSCPGFPGERKKTKQLSFPEDHHEQPNA